MTYQSVVTNINENYDRNILVFIFVATGFVLTVFGILAIVGVTSPVWLLLPASWWVGAMMVWASSKIKK